MPILNYFRKNIKIPNLHQITPYRETLNFKYAEGTYMYKLICKGGLKYEGEVTSLLLGLLSANKKSIFIDVGGNIGYFPVLLGGILGENCEITVFEPLPRLFEICQQGILKNVIRAEIRSEALSDSIGSATFYVSAQSDSSNSLNPTFRKHKDQVNVSLSTLDHYFLVEQRSKLIKKMLTNGTGDIPIVLMIDTESTEPDVLNGGKEFITKFRPHIICEVLAGRTEQALTNFFTEMNYSCNRLDHYGIHKEIHIVGDRSYKFRDWYFSPTDVTSELNDLYLKQLKYFI